MHKPAQPFDTRQEMRVPDYEIFHYRDAQLDSVPVHHHDFYEIYFFLSGHVEYLVEGHSYQLRPGDLLLISPLELHQTRVYSSEAAYERIVLWVSPAFLHRFTGESFSLTRCFDTSRQEHTNLLHPATAQQNRLLELLQQLVEESDSGEYGHEALALGLLTQFLVQLNRLALAAGPARREPQPPSPLVQAAVAHINTHYQKELTLEDLSRRLFVSKYHLSHEFNRLVGTSVYRYIILKRLQHAKQMLAGGVAPTVVCQNCGFKDYANFYRAFKAEYGQTPSQYLAGLAL